MKTRVLHLILQTWDQKGSRYRLLWCKCAIATEKGHGAFVLTYQVSVTHMCGRKAESERRGSTANCDWRLPLLTEINQSPAERQKMLDLIKVYRVEQNSFWGRVSLELSLTLFPENPMNSNNLKIL